MEFSFEQKITKSIQRQIWLKLSGLTSYLDARVVKVSEAMHFQGTGTKADQPNMFTAATELVPFLVC